MSPAGRPRDTKRGVRPRVNVTLDPAHVAYFQKRGAGNLSRGVRVVVDEAINAEQRKGTKG